MKLINRQLLHKFLTFGILCLIVRLLSLQLFALPRRRKGKAGTSWFSFSRRKSKYGGGLMNYACQGVEKTVSQPPFWRSALISKPNIQSTTKELQNCHHRRRIKRKMC
jgi:hypothetical protein